MAALLDTSVIVRYLTGDPPRLAARAAARTVRAEAVYSFDERFPAEGVQVTREA